jgi:uncharacterized protein YbbC (DUF1343 family)
LPDLLRLRYRWALLLGGLLPALYSLGSEQVPAVQTFGEGVRPSGVLSGIDVLIQRSFVPLRGKRVGLITNPSGVARDGRATIDVLAAAPGVRLVAESAQRTAHSAQREGEDNAER